MKVIHRTALHWAKITSISVLCLVIFATVTMMVSAITVPTSKELSITTYPGAELVAAKNELNIATLNLAHGRKQNFNQLLTGTKETKTNLADISDFLVLAKADVVALQEADMPSRWSGKFNHVDLIAQRAGYPQSVHTAHVDMWLGKYGTAILTNQAISHAKGFTFPPSPPTTRKGFTLAEVEWLTPAGVVPLDVISIHMDFSRQTVREQQLAELKQVLSLRVNPVVIMGDFNSAEIAKKLVSSATAYQLHTWQPENEELATYKKKRLDWIVLSDQLRFKHFEVSSVPLSDHRALVATISLNEP